jgi:hypothetical protein
LLLVAKWHLGTNLDNLCVLVGAPCWRRLPQLYRNWKIWEFICWSWTSENQAYWHFCVPCHNREWPHMPRPGQGNRFTKPPDHVVARRPVVGRTLAGVAQKAVGEFYLTSAAPERRSSQAVLDKVQAALERHRATQGPPWNFGRGGLCQQCSAVPHTAPNRYTRVTIVR